MSIEYGFSFSNDKCTQCFGCEVACKNWRDGELGVRWRRVYKIWAGRYPEVKLASVSVSCMHCVDPVCVKTCPVQAIQKRPDDGIVVVDKGKCIGRKSCEKECPFGAPQFGADGKMQKCDLCLSQVELGKESPPCVETCPTKALQLSKLETKEKGTIENAIQKLVEGAASTR
ncbi:MAG TPA: 4Fe-4S dicluster domain-containing protein [Syntrophorhabdales bacterium]|nr:4Fe-4S dicluster domain-containing protein [Syntrophorhabdales bacterium]